MANTMIQYVSLGFTGLFTGLIYALMAIGLSVVFGVTRIVNFAHGEMLVLAAFIAIYLHKSLGIDPLLLIPLVSIIMFGVGYFLQKLMINRLLNRSEHSQFLALAAMAIILLNLQQIIFGSEAQAIVTSYSLQSIEIWGVLFDTVRLLTGAIAFIVIFLLLSFFYYTHHGKAIRACADNLLGSQIIGLNYKKLYAFSFAVAAACLGVAGTLLSLVIDVTPHTAPQLTLLSFIIVILGGLGSMVGALIGGILIGVIESYAAFFVQGSLKSLFSFLILILILLIRPQGLLAKKQ
jgi:branched-chain amino acid transport system permease protein